MKLEPKEAIRNTKSSSSPRCRCHHNSKSVDMTVIKKCRMTPRKIILSKPELIKKKPVNKTVTITKPENWIVDSWNSNQPLSKMENSSYFP